MKKVQKKGVSTNEKRSIHGGVVHKSPHFSGKFDFL